MKNNTKNNWCYLYFGILLVFSGVVIAMYLLGDYSTTFATIILSILPYFVFGIFVDKNTGIAVFASTLIFSLLAARMEWFIYLNMQILVATGLSFYAGSVYGAKKSSFKLNARLGNPLSMFLAFVLMYSSYFYLDNFLDSLLV